MIKLNASAIRFMLRRERNAHGRLLFESVVQEKHIVITESPCQERIPKPPDGFAHPTDREKIINNRHPVIFMANAVTRNFCSARQASKITISCLELSMRALVIRRSGFRG